MLLWKSFLNQVEDFSFRLPQQSITNRAISKRPFKSITNKLQNIPQTQSTRCHPGSPMKFPRKISSGNTGIICTDSNFQPIVQIIFQRINRQFLSFKHIVIPEPYHLKRTGRGQLNDNIMIQKTAHQHGIIF